MKDNGFNFYTHNDYFENIMTNHFDITHKDLKKFDLLTAFEPIEHFIYPINDIVKIFEYS